MDRTDRTGKIAVQDTKRKNGTIKIYIERQQKYEDTELDTWKRNGGSGITCSAGSWGKCG